MASNRHLGRIVALQTLYECDFRSGSGDTSLDVGEVLTRNANRYHGQVGDQKFVSKLVKGVLDHIGILDAELQPVAPEWPLEQIARIDRSILRLGWFELKYEQDVPPKVAINEAVELAKAFGGENSSRFINGVLGTLLESKEALARETAKTSSINKPAKPARKASPNSAQPKPRKSSNRKVVKGK